MSTEQGHRWDTARAGTKLMAGGCQFLLPAAARQTAGAAEEHEPQSS